jgi:hypothetical protein
MKIKEITLIIAFLIITEINAQTYPLYNTPENVFFVDGAYYKDLNNDLNKYEGKWRLNLNSTSFIEIEFKKIIQYNDLTLNKKYDVLIGECKYVLNNTIIFNTIPNINNTYTNHYFVANGIVDSVRGIWNFDCPYCLNNEKFITGGLEDSERSELPSKLVMRHFLESGIEKIKIMFHVYGSVMEDYPFDDFRLHSGQYVLTKID